MLLSEIVVVSLACDMKCVKWYPSNLFRPHSVPTQMNPNLSWQIFVTALLERYSEVYSLPFSAKVLQHDKKKNKNIIVQRCFIVIVIDLGAKLHKNI